MTGAGVVQLDISVSPTRQCLVWEKKGSSLRWRTELEIVGRDQPPPFETGIWPGFRSKTRLEDHTGVTGYECHLSASTVSQSVPDDISVDRPNEKRKKGKSLLPIILYKLQVKRENVLLHSCGYQTESLSPSSRWS